MQFLYDILSFFTSNAYAADAGGSSLASPAGGGEFSLVLMTGIFLLFMYFAVWRPQSKRAKEHRLLIGALAKEDEVVTAGGILGKVVKVTDHYVILALADNITITVQKNAIVNALPKGTMKSIA